MMRHHALHLFMVKQIEAVSKAISLVLELASRDCARSQRATYGRDVKQEGFHCTSAVRLRSIYTFSPFPESSDS